MSFCVCGLGAHPKREAPRMVGVQYATGEESSRKNEEAEPKRKQSPGVDVTGDGSTVR